MYLGLCVTIISDFTIQHCIVILKRLFIVYESLQWKLILSHVCYWIVSLPCMLHKCEFYIKHDDCTHSPKWPNRYSVCHFCLVAIKTGRYTYEKKTNIIKEVKRLELARLAALPTQSSSDNVVTLSKMTQQTTDNKYDIVIEKILAAYREHPLLEVNFLADMKRKEETYLASVCVLMTGSSV